MTPADEGFFGARLLDAVRSARCPKLLLPQHGPITFVVPDSVQRASLASFAARDARIEEAEDAARQQAEAFAAGYQAGWKDACFRVLLNGRPAPRVPMDDAEAAQRAPEEYDATFDPEGRI
jgi:hypothetical protein